MYNVIDLLTNVLIDTDVESLEEARAYAMLYTQDNSGTPYLVVEDNGNDDYPVIGIAFEGKWFINSETLPKNVND